MINSLLKKHILNPKVSIIALFLLFGVIFFTFTLAFQKQDVRSSAQSMPGGVTPTLYCMGSCPTGSPNPSTAAGGTAPSVAVGTPSAMTSPIGGSSNAIITATSGPSTAPCVQSAISTQGNRGEHAYHMRRGRGGRGGGGALSGGMDMLIKLLMEFFNLIIKLLGGTPLAAPATPGGPSGMPVPVTGAQTNPCPSGSAGAPAPSSGQALPSSGQAPSGGQPSSGPAPSGTTGTTSCTKEISSGTSISDSASGLQAGDTLCVKGGDYSEEVNLSASGSDGKPITIRASDASQMPVITKMTISGSFINVNNFEITGGGDPLVQIEQGSSNITVKDSKIHDGQGNGVRTYGNYITFEGNDLYAFQSEDAFRIWGDNLTFRNNHIHDIQNPGHNDIWQTYQTDTKIPVTNLLLEGNKIENNTGGNAHCLMLESDGSNNFTVRNNTFDNIGSHCFILGKPGESGVANVKFENNTFKNVGGNAIECQGQTSGTITGNTFDGVGGQEVNNASGQCTVN